MKRIFISKYSRVRRKLLQKEKKPLHLRILKQRIEESSVKRKSRRGFSDHERDKVWKALINTAVQCNEIQIEQTRLSKKISEIDLSFLDSQTQERTTAAMNILAERKILPSLSVSFPVVVSLCFFFEEKTAVALVEKLLGAKGKGLWHYLPLSNAEALILSSVFERLLDIFVPVVSVHIKKIKKKEPQFTPAWRLYLADLFLSVYTHHFFLRFMDTFYTEGYKVVYRHALAHVCVFENQFLNAASGLEINNCIARMPDEKKTHEIFKKAFAIKIKRKKIEECRTDAFFAYEKNAFVGVVLPLTESSILSEDCVLMLLQWIPHGVKMRDMKRVYCTDENGFCLKAFYKKCEKYDNMLLVIKTVSGKVFGAFLSQELSRRKNTNSFFGTGETFLFSLLPYSMKYSWKKEYCDLSFVFADDTMLCFGHGRNGFGLFIDRWFQHVCFEDSKTYGNAALTKGKERLSCLEAFHFFL